MRVDIYKRSELAGQYSYLAVPEGKLIPQEATNTDWEPAERSVDLDDNADALPRFSIAALRQQIDAKGYAITTVASLIGNGHVR